MQSFFDVLAKLPSLAPEQLMGLIALAALGLAAFAIYVIFSITGRRSQ